MTLTKRFADGARHDGKGDYTIHWDGKIPGFGLRVSRGGTKAFILDYRDASHRKRRVTIGRFGTESTVDKARKRAIAMLGGKVEGEDPAEAKRRKVEGDTLADIADGYLEDLKQRAEAGSKKGRLSGWHTQKALLERHVRPRLGRRKADDLTVKDVRRLHRKLAETPATADHVRSAIHAVYEWAILEGRAESNPAAGVKPYDKPGKSRRRLTTDELAALGQTLDEAEAEGRITIGEKNGNPIRRKVPVAAILAVRLLALTGMRRSELLGHTMKGRRGPREGLRWSEVDLEGGLYMLRAHGGGSGDKGGAPRTLPLGSAAVELLKTARPEDADPEAPICPSPRDPDVPFVGIDKVRVWLWRVAKIEGQGADLHSLRHTFETIAYQFDPGHAGVLTGRALTRDAALNRYLHPEQQKFKDLADRVSDHIAAALAGRLAGVLEFKRSGSGSEGGKDGQAAT